MELLRQPGPESARCRNWIFPNDADFKAADVSDAKRKEESESETVSVGFGDKHLSGGRPAVHPLLLAACGSRRAPAPQQVFDGDEFRRRAEFYRAAAATSVHVSSRAGSS